MMEREWAAFSDEQLWSRAVEGRDSAAFGQLFERHADAVYNHCFRLTGSWSTAEDLTSVVFLQAWRRRDDVRFSGASVLPWLLAVANNAARNAARSLRRRRRLLAKLPPPQAVPDVAEDAVRRADQERAMRWLLAAIRGLSRSEREVLFLCDWAGLSYAEAADAIGVPVGTVRSRLARSRQHLRDRAARDQGPLARAAFNLTGTEDQ
jgi:RNA polymerase sigma factor (sigma-70 family)